MVLVAPEYSGAQSERGPGKGAALMQGITEGVQQMLREKLERERLKKAGSRVHQILDEDGKSVLGKSGLRKYLGELTARYTPYDAAFRHDIALPIAERALAAAEYVYGDHSSELLPYLDDVAKYNFSQEYIDRAHALALRSQTIREKKFGANHPEVAKSLTMLARWDHFWDRQVLGHLYWKREEGDRCQLKEPILSLDKVSDLSLSGPNFCAQIVARANRAERIRRKAFGIGAGEHSMSIFLAAKFNDESVFYHEAWNLMILALQAHRNRPGTDPRIMSIIARYIANKAIAGADRRDLVHTTFDEIERTITFVKKQPPGAHQHLAELLDIKRLLLDRLGGILTSKEKYNIILKEIISNYEAAFGDEFWLIADSLFRLSIYHSERGFHKRAVPFLERVVRIEERHLPHSAETLAFVKDRLATLREHANRLEP
ncbi:MAG: hypothetical protein HN403_19105 [Rhodospirillales bacterium]|nr:hypothetical protein [Rhodospirillales bacterium]